MSLLTYLKLAGGVALLAATAVIADSNGANRVIAREAKTLARATDAMAQGAKRLNAAQDRITTLEGQRIQTVREIYREVPKLVDRPVYRTVGIDDDGVRLLDRAAAAANGDGGSQPAPAAGVGAEGGAKH